MKKAPSGAKTTSAASRLRSRLPRTARRRARTGGRPSSALRPTQATGTAGKTRAEV